MNDLIPNVRIQGEVKLQGQNIFAPEVDVTDLRRQVRMVFQKANPFPMSLFDNIAYGPRLHGNPSKAELTEIVETALRGAALWDEVKGTSQAKCHWGCPADSGSAFVLPAHLPCSPMSCSWTNPPVLWTREALCVSKTSWQSSGKKNYTVVIVTHNMQQAARISSKTAFFLTGELIEFGETCELFTNPKEKKTEDYITGRFG